MKNCSRLIILLIVFAPLFCLGQDLNSAEELDISLPRFRVQLSSGLGYLLANTDEAKKSLMDLGTPEQEAEDYYKNYRLGAQAGGNIHYLIDQEYGIGLEYRYFQTDGSANGYADPQDGIYLYYGELSEQVYTNYVGASFLMQKELLRSNWKYFVSYSLGWTFYRDEMMYIYSPLVVTGNAFGATGELGIEYMLNRHISISAGVSAFLSTLRKVTYDDGVNSEEIELEDDQKENLSRVNLSGGLHFYF